MNTRMEVTREDTGEVVSLEGRIVTQVRSREGGGARIEEIALGEGIVAFNVDETYAQVLRMYGEPDAEESDRIFEAMVAEGRREDALVLCKRRLQGVTVERAPVFNRWREREDRARAIPQQVRETEIYHRWRPSGGPAAREAQVWTGDPETVQIVLEDEEGRAIACTISRERMRELAAEGAAGTETREAA